MGAATRTGVRPRLRVHLPQRLAGWTGITGVTQILNHQTLSGDAEEALRSAHAVARDTAKLKQLGYTTFRK